VYATWRYASTTTKTTNNNNDKSVTLCSQQRAPDCFASCLTRETPSGRCQGKTRSGRPVVVSSAPLNLPRTHTTLGRNYISFFPPPGRPSPPTVHSLHLRRDHHRPMPSSHVYLPTYIQLDLHSHIDPLDSPISRAPATSLSAVRTFYNRVDRYP
jgi:hypothetical protein